MEAATLDEVAFSERLTSVLNKIPSEFQQEDFNALAEILDLLENEDSPGMSPGAGGYAGAQQGGSGSEYEGGDVSYNDSIEVRLQKTMKNIDADWEMVIDNYFHGFNYCIKSFTSVIKPKVGESLDELHMLKQKLDKAKLYAGSRTTDLRDKHLKRTQHIEMLRILDIVDELNGVMPELDGMLRIPGPATPPWGRGPAWHGPLGLTGRPPRLLQGAGPSWSTSIG